MITYKINFSHRESSQNVYNVYLAEKLVGILKQCFKSNSYMFVSNKSVSMSRTTYIFKDLATACLELPELLQIWIVLAAINGAK